MATVAQVASWMNWYGWSNGGYPGSVKKDASGKVVARHGDGQWLADVAKAVDRTERDRRSRDLMDEYEAAERQ